MDQKPPNPGKNLPGLGTSPVGIWPRPGLVKTGMGRLCYMQGLPLSHSSVSGSHYRPHAVLQMPGRDVLNSPMEEDRVNPAVAEDSPMNDAA